MSSIRLTEQDSNLPAPGEDQGAKTVELFAKDDPSNPGTTVPTAVDSDNNVSTFVGPQGIQGVQGIPGPIGPPGTLAMQFVTDINNPTELEVLTLLGVGSDILAHQVIGAGISDVITSYLYDDDGPAKNAPFVMNTGDGGTTRWIASGGTFDNNNKTFNGNLIMVTDRTVDGRDVSVDGIKLDGIATGAQVNNPNTALKNIDNNFSTLQTFQNNAVIQGQAHSETNTLVDVAIIAVNFNTGNVQTVILGGDRTLENPTNLKNGGTYIFIIKQDLTGGRTLAYDSKYKFERGITQPLSLAANAIDLLSCVSDGTNLFCQLIKDFR